MIEVIKERAEVEVLAPLIGKLVDARLRMKHLRAPYEALQSKMRELGIIKEGEEGGAWSELNGMFSMTLRETNRMIVVRWEGS